MTDDYERYFYNQVTTGSSPDFISSRGLAWRRQTGTGIFSFLRRAGKPLLKFFGKQAAGLATSVGKSYLENSRLSKEDLKSVLKQQMREAASDLVEKAQAKLQTGSGASSWRRRSTYTSKGKSRSTPKKRSSSSSSARKRTKPNNNKNRINKKKKTTRKKKKKVVTRRGRGGEGKIIRSRDIFGLVH